MSCQNNVLSIFVKVYNFKLSFVFNDIYLFFDSNYLSYKHDYDDCARIYLNHIHHHYKVLSTV